MNILNLEMINAHAEYQVFMSQSGKYLFKTDYGILYAVDFELDNNPYYTAYWFNLTNPEHSKSPGDIKIPQTIICIIEEFFRLNPEVLLYMCSTDNGQQAQRARLFLRWFNGYKQQQKYVIKATDVNSTDSKGKPSKDYVALIIQRTHPVLNEIIQRFDEEIQMFNDYKPVT
jgi:hypothetical protein